MPTASEHLTSTTINGKLYVIGGRTAGMSTNVDANEGSKCLLYLLIQRKWQNEKGWNRNENSDFFLPYTRALSGLQGVEVPS
jgi:hypothetical protein